MMGKIYFWGILGFSAFVFYYQFIVTQNYKWFDVAQLFILIGALLGGYSYFFKRPIISFNNWQILYKIIVINIILNIIIQIWPTSYLGNFSLLNNGLLVNIFAYLSSLMIFIPLYWAVYRLSKYKTLGKKVTLKRLTSL